MTAIIPTGKQILVKPIEEPEETDRLQIIVPDLAKKDKHTGRVLAMGPEVCAGGEVPLLVVGDTVIYRTHATTEIEVEGEKYLVMHVEGVLVILR